MVGDCTVCFQPVYHDAWGSADWVRFPPRYPSLAIDSGPCHGQTTSVLKLYSQGTAGAVSEYGRQTIAHNSITIGDSEFTHVDWRGQPTDNIVRRGGQSVPQARQWWQAWGFEDQRQEFMKGRITAYRTHPLYDYALGDARFSYNPADLACHRNPFAVRSVNTAHADSTVGEKQCSLPFSVDRDHLLRRPCAGVGLPLQILAARRRGKARPHRDKAVREANGTASSYKPLRQAFSRASTPRAGRRENLQRPRLPQLCLDDPQRNGFVGAGHRQRRSPVRRTV